MIAFLAATLPNCTIADNGFSSLQSTVGPLAAIAQAVPADLKLAAKNSVNNTQTEAQQRVFGHLLYRSRRQQLLLSRAARNLEEGKAADAFLYLQTLIDAPQDSFTWLADESRLVSVRAESMRLLGSQPKQILQTYERIYRAEANSLLATARETGDPERFRDLGRRYYFTSAGFQAMDWQASRWFDQGDMGQAARVWKRLASEPAHRHRMTQTMLLKTALALKLTGAIDESELFAGKFGDRGIHLGNGELATQAWLDRRAIGTTLSTRLANQAVWPGRNLQQPLAIPLLLSLLGIAVSGGMFVVPLYAFLTTFVPKTQTARTIAANNIVNSGAMVGGSLIVSVLSALAIPILQQLLLSAALCLLSSWLASRLLQAEREAVSA